MCWGTVYPTVTQSFCVSWLGEGPLESQRSQFRFFTDFVIMASNPLLLSSNLPFYGNGHTDTCIMRAIAWENV